jgi:site-specific recombinase
VLGNRPNLVERKCAIIRNVDPTGNPVQALAALPADAGGMLESQWLQDSLAWLRCDGGESIPPSTLTRTTHALYARRTLRLRELAAAVEESGMRDRIALIWSRAAPHRLLSDAALPEETSLLREISVRLKRRLLPRFGGELDLYSALDAAGLRAADVEWLANLSEQDAAPWSDIAGVSPEDVCKALRLLAARVVAIGLSRDLARVMPDLWRNERGEPDSPFDQLLEAVPGFPGNTAPIEELLLRCRMLVGVAHARLEEEGVSSNLVFRLDLLGAQIERMEALVRLQDGREDRRKFAVTLVGGFAGSHGSRSLLHNAVNRLARRIVEHTGHTGEHCIAGSRREWQSMGWGAAGAGAITAFTALFKYSLGSASLAPLWVGVAQSLNYAASFLLMQALGWMLASKMPSMTAAALARALSERDGMHAEVNLIAAITRTQFIVTTGNLFGAVPSALLVDAFLRWRTGHSFLSEDAALHGLHSMNPFTSWTILFAAITGGFLWLASLSAGWTANWVRFHRLPAAIAHSRTVRRFLGPRLAAKLGGFLQDGFSGAIGYVCLGFLLGLVPFLGAFAGIGLEVRHITLASASVAYDISAFFHKAGAPVGAMIAAGFGVVVTGLLNFTISFILGLWLAVRARNLGVSQRRTLLRAVVREMRHSPARFLWARFDGYNPGSNEPRNKRRDRVIGVAAG